MALRSVGVDPQAAGVLTDSGGVSPPPDRGTNLNFPVDPGTRALLQLLMQDRHYGCLLIGPGNRILDASGSAAHLLKRTGTILVGQRLEAIGRREPAATAHGTFVVSGPEGDLRTLTCQQLPTEEPGLQVLVLRADAPLAPEPGPAAWAGAEAFFHSIDRSTRAVLWVSDPALEKFLYVSPAFRHLWGLPLNTGQAPGIWRDPVVEEDLPRVQAFIEALKAGQIAEMEVRIRPQDGPVRWLWAHACPWTDSQRQARVTGLVADITTRRQENGEARWEALLREGHHRIKNSLQGLAALLHRHAGSAGEQAAVLTEAVGQVRAIAAVHDLYSRQGQPPVTLAELLDTLVKSVDGLYPEHSPIERIPASGIDNTAIPSSEVVPLAIIVNELLTNAAKHGSPGTSPQDMIRVHTRADENGISLRIDNPGSLPAGFDFDDRQGLGNGLQLMAALLNPPHTDLSLRQVTPQTVSATLHLARPPIRPQHNLSHVP